MNKDTKILLGVAGLALLGFFIWEKSSKDATNDSTKSFVNASGKSGNPCTFKMDLRNTIDQNSETFRM